MPLIHVQDIDYIGFDGFLFLPVLFNWQILCTIIDFKSLLTISMTFVIFFFFFILNLTAISDSRIRQLTILRRTKKGPCRTAAVRQIEARTRQVRQKPILRSTKKI